MILTTPFGKEEGCDATTECDYKGGSAGFTLSNKFSPQYKIYSSCRTSLTLRQARPQNKLNMCSGFNWRSNTTLFFSAFDTCLNQTQLNFIKGGNQNG